FIAEILPFAQVRSRRSSAAVEQGECHRRKSFAFLGKRSAFRRLRSRWQACPPILYGSWLLRVGSSREKGQDKGKEKEKDKERREEEKRFQNPSNDPRRVLKPSR